MITLLVNEIGFDTDEQHWWQQSKHKSHAKYHSRWLTHITGDRSKYFVSVLVTKGCFTVCCRSQDHTDTDGEKIMLLRVYKDSMQMISVWSPEAGICTFTGNQQ